MKDGLDSTTVSSARRKTPGDYAKSGAVSAMPRIRALDETLCLATWDRVLLQIWRKEPTATAVANLHKVGLQFVSEHRLPVNSLAIVEPTSPAPNDVVRAALSRFYRDLAPRMQEQIVVAEGSGFRAALVRSVGVALSSIAPKSVPFKFVRTVDAAVVLIARHLSAESGGTWGLHHAIAQVRTQYGQ